MMRGRKSNKKRISRRRFLQSAAAAATAIGCGKQDVASVASGAAKKMIVLGVDGMDPRLTELFMRQGRMPNCVKLIQAGGFLPLQTSDPPQSPVAWSNFISGTNPGGHGIFDFIARDPNTMLPYQSTARAVQSRDPLRVGSWQIPLGAGQLQNLRGGPTFWNELTKHGIPTTVYRVPANFPPTETDATTVSGMGTPDMQGGYGVFTYLTNEPGHRTRDVPGGHIERVKVVDNVVQSELHGPEDLFSAEPTRVKVPVTVYLDPDQGMARIELQDSVTVLQEGEWSDWLRVEFPVVSHLASASGICRVLLKSVGDFFRLYISPVNIDPTDPSVPLSTPPDYIRELAREKGYFYTQGMIEDTHALSAGVLTEEEYRQQATFAINERMQFFDHELNRFSDGFLFFYFSSLDLSSHVFWRTLDAEHPLYSQSLAENHAGFIPALYRTIDKAIGQVLELADDDTVVMVMSDHGFTSFRRQFNLNSWLMDEGYIKPSPHARRGVNSFFQDVDWTGTRAYGLGINSLYLNLQGRERDGTVAAGAEADALMDELITRLKSVRDPDNGDRVVSEVFRSRDIYSGPYVDDAPDLIVAYNNFYRASWDTVLGSFPLEHVLDNTDAWSGDHCIDARFVPGVLMCNRSIEADEPTLSDLAPTILAQFDVPIPAEMTGENIL